MPGINLWAACSGYGYGCWGGIACTVVGRQGVGTGLANPTERESRPTRSGWAQGQVHTKSGWPGEGKAGAASGEGKSAGAVAGLEQHGTHVVNASTVGDTHGGRGRSLAGTRCSAHGESGSRGEVSQYYAAALYAVAPGVARCSRSRQGYAAARCNGERRCSGNTYGDRAGRSLILVDSQIDGGVGDSGISGQIRSGCIGRILPGVDGRGAGQHRQTIVGSTPGIV